MTKEQQLEKERELLVILQEESLKLTIAERRAQLKELEKKGPEPSENTSKSVNLGFIFERIAPTLPDFPFDKNDCRSMFDPID